MKYRNAVFAVLLFLMSAGPASAQYVSYVASPSGVSYGASPSVLSLEIQTGYPRAIVRKNDWTAFQTSGTMHLYQNGIVIASAPQSAGTSFVPIPPTSTSVPTRRTGVRCSSCTARTSAPSTGSRRSAR